MRLINNEKLNNKCILIDCPHLDVWACEFAGIFCCTKTKKMFDQISIKPTNLIF